MTEDFSRVSLFERYPSRNGVLAPLTSGSVRPSGITAESGQYVFVNLWAAPYGHPLTYQAVYDLASRQRRRPGEDARKSLEAAGWFTGREVR